MTKPSNLIPSHNSTITLQPLRIPSGWHVDYNEGLYAIDPLASHLTEQEKTVFFKEDMLQISHYQRQILLDVGWYPSGDVRFGQYILVVYQSSFQGPLLYRYTTRNRSQLVAEIERLLHEQTTE